MGRSHETGATTPLASAARVLLLMVLLFVLLTFLGAARLPSAPGFIGVTYWQDTINVFDAHGAGWTVPTRDGCRIAIMPAERGQPRLQAAADPGGPRTDEECRDLYRRPRRTGAATDR